MTTIRDTGGRFNDDAGGDPRRIKTVYLPRTALNEVRPTTLAVFPNLRALMIIENTDGTEKKLTGSMIDDAEDLLALEYAYKNEKCID